MAATHKDSKAIELARQLENVPWCEDYEKMISGMLYSCQAPALVAGRFRARKLMHQYNHHFPDTATDESLQNDREAMLRSMLGKVGKGTFIEPPLNIDYGCNISIGERFYSNFKSVNPLAQPERAPRVLWPSVSDGNSLVILDCGLVTIGNRVMFGPFVSIFAATHETSVQSRRDDIEYARSVTIGDDCWIGGNTTIMPGVTIGKGCTIGAGSVVTKDIPDFSVAMGTPAKVVKQVTPVPDL